MRKYYLAFCFLFFLLGRTDAYDLFRNGKTDYAIMLASDASASEKSAAKELQQMFCKIGNVTLPITDVSIVGKKYIYVGYQKKLLDCLGVRKPQEQDESFTYRTYKGELFIYGGSQRGTMYGVYSFLEQQLGVRWYTQDETKIPRRSYFALSDLNHSETPAFQYRHDFYCINRYCHDWDAHNLVNMEWTAHTTPYGNLSGYWGGHTMQMLLPAEQYYSPHPEFFSLKDGKRIRDGQLCLSNPQVLKIVTGNFLKVIQENPGYFAYSLSQNDNKNPCECENCRSLEKKYGGHSGLILWFVNQVADVVKKQYPNIYVGTFAYLYSRQAPRNIVPRKNVVIRLCDIDCCFAHPLAECPENKSFLSDFLAWRKLTNRIFIWDYVVDFRHYNNPYPNYGVLAKNLQLFQKCHVMGVKEQGQYENFGGEFYELKAWVLAKLLWNPNQNAKQLAEEFISDYYGTCSDDILKYFNLCQSLVTEHTHFGIQLDCGDSIYTKEFVDQAMVYLNDAKEKSQGNEVLTDRVDNVRLQILYLYSKRFRNDAFRDGASAEMVRIMKKKNTIVGEGRSVDKFLKEENYY